MWAMHTPYKPQVKWHHIDVSSTVASAPPVEISSSHSTCECTSMESDVAKFQSTEKPDVFKFSYPYNSRIKPKVQFPYLRSSLISAMLGKNFREDIRFAMEDICVY